MTMNMPIRERQKLARERALAIRRAAREIYLKRIAISNTKKATMLPYDSNSTSNYSRFGVDTLSRVKLQPTDAEIIESVLYPEKRKHGKRDVRRLDPSCMADEVKEYWRDRLRQSELQRGRLYAKTKE